MAEVVFGYVMTGLYGAGSALYDSRVGLVIIGMVCDIKREFRGGLGTSYMVLLSRGRGSTGIV